MAITDILLRFTSHPPLTTKGSELTFVEGDANLIEIYEYLQSLASAAGISPYNAGTTYTGTTYVTYGGNLWQHVAATSTGVTPGSNPAVWTLTSIGTLAHQQNTDTALATGTANQVTAAEIKSLLGNSMISVSYASLVALYTAQTLKPGYWYFINDKDIALQAVNPGNLSGSGFYLAKNPDFDNVSGLMLQALGDSVWGPPTSAWWVNVLTVFTTIPSRVGKCCIYKGKHYENLTGANTITSPDLDATNWAEVIKTSPLGVSTYRPDVDLIVYDFLGDLINQRIDKYNNRVSRYFGETEPLEERFQFGNSKVQNNESLGRFENYGNHGQIKNNFIDTSSRVYITDQDTTGGFIGNTFIASEVFFEGNKSVFQNNTFNNCITLDMTGQSTGSFVFNNFTNCFYSDFQNNEALVERSSFNWLYSQSYIGTPGTNLDLCYFSNALHYEPGVALSGLYISPGTSNQDKAITISDTDSNIVLRYRTEAMVTITGTGSALLTDIYLDDTQKGKVVKIYPDAGSVLNLDCGVSNIRNVANTLTTLSLDGSLGHYVLGVWIDGAFEIIKENI